MAVVVEGEGLPPRFLDNNQVVPEHDEHWLSQENEKSPSFILRIIKETMEVIDLGEKRVDVYIDGEKCSDYQGMMFLEQFYIKSPGGRSELIQCWHAPPTIGESFSVIKKVMQITERIKSFKIKEVGSRDFLLCCYKTPKFPKRIKRKRRDGFL